MIVFKGVMYSIGIIKKHRKGLLLHFREDILLR